MVQIPDGCRALKAVSYYYVDSNNDPKQVGVFLKDFGVNCNVIKVYEKQNHVFVIMMLAKCGSLYIDDFPTT